MTEINTYLAIEGTPRLLKAEIIIEFLVREVAALQRDVVAPMLHTVGQGDIVRELPGHHIIALVGTDAGGIVRKAMQVLIVIRHHEHIALPARVAPVKGYIRIGEHIGQVRHPLPISQIGRIAGNGGLHIVTHVHLGEITPYAHPIAPTVTEGKRISFGQDFAIVDVLRGVFATAQIGDVALDVIFRVPINQSSFHIHGMFAECLVITQILVHDKN